MISDCMIFWKRTLWSSYFQVWNWCFRPFVDRNWHHQQLQPDLWDQAAVSCFAYWFYWWNQWTKLRATLGNKALCSFWFAPCCYRLTSFEIELQQTTDSSWSLLVAASMLASVASYLTLSLLSDRRTLCSCTMTKSSVVLVADFLFRRTKNCCFVLGSSTSCYQLQRQGIGCLEHSVEWIPSFLPCFRRCWVFLIGTSWSWCMVWCASHLCLLLR